MKNQNFKAIALIILIAFASISANATKWRINNKAGSDPDFTTPQLANDNASVLNGDTLLIEGSTVTYGDVTFNKKLVIIGPGYFLSENPETQANLSTAWLEEAYFDAGSDSSIMMGIFIDYRIRIYANAVIIKRCYVEYYGVDIFANNVMLLQNYIGLTAGSDAIEIGTGLSNILIQNNYISTSSLSYAAFDIEGTSTAIISQNVIYGDLYLRNSNLSNNILRDGDLLENVNCTYLKNICNSTQFPVDSNMQGVDMATVFEGTGSTDAQWKLAIGGPAIGYGTSGDDCGMFGGIDPYVLSGIPPIPAIYYFSAPSSASTATGLPVTIRIKSNK